MTATNSTFQSRSPAIALLALGLTVGSALPAMSLGTLPAAEQLFLPSAPAFDVRNGGRTTQQPKIAILHRRKITRVGLSSIAREARPIRSQSLLLPAALMLALGYAEALRRRTRAA
ncbi:MAG: hypothetical protein ABL897_05445 [Hyphomicrobium sp.]